ncbi:sulfotransferase 1E1-like [Prorops nasuta]|uniref:sulfotransferase 1E1-like n=1 Tax=Prorops nasuta TaxID=863751 RepID=UPI0034CF14FE
MSKKSAPKYQLLDKDITAEMLKTFKGERDGWVQVGEKGWFFPYRYIEQGEKFYKFEARKDDTWVISYPRSGTTWTQELVWLLSNNLDFETARKKYLSERFPFLEFSMFNHPEVTKEFLEMNKFDSKKKELVLEIAKPGYEVLEVAPSPRFIKSHFPFSLLPGILESGCKIVYVARNAKDVAVSWYHLNKDIKTQGYQGDFPTFWNYFQNHLTPWSPYWEHLKEAWNNRNHPNVLFIFYEEMQQDLIASIKKIAKFLKKEYTDKEIETLADYLHIQNFRSNPMVNSSELKDCNIITAGAFVRNGTSGSWQDTFTPELENKANLWIEENLKGTDFRFPCYNNNYQ